MIRVGTAFIGFMFLFLPSLLHSTNIEADFSVEFGIVGQVGKVHATLISDTHSYVLDANVSTQGIAKAVTHNLKERHISKGHVVKGLLRTDMYQMIKSYGAYTSTTIYRVNHKTKKLTREYKKWEYDSVIIHEKRALDYYGKDDILTFFLNLPKYIKAKHKAKKYQFKVIGADRKNGRVDVMIPSEKMLKEMIAFVGLGEEGDWHSTIVMHRKLYHSKQGELAVRTGKEGLVEKAVLKDLIFFGDLRIIKQ